MEPSELDVRSLYEEHARACDPKDFQSQVIRTPKGRPVGEDQVTLIVDAIVKGLHLRPDDELLDLCCGNGAITDPVFSRCHGGVGVDFTPYLIEVAKANFERAPARLYRLADVLDYIETTEDSGRFSKVMCYGAFQCLREEKAISVLTTLRRRFPKLRRVFLGNLPDLDLAEGFFRRNGGTEVSASELKRHDTLFGIWRTVDETIELARQCGWGVEISRMPPEFYGAPIRFDASLMPA